MGQEPLDHLHLREDSISINLEMGNPAMFEQYWRKMEERGSVFIAAWEKMSYFSSGSGVCWFMERELEREIVRMHEIVGNAATDGKHLIVGVGSTQLFQAALYALSPDSGEPMDVVSASPFYSFYRDCVEYVQSRLYRWTGDARTFQSDNPFIEVICMPNNPDGFLNQAVLGEDRGRRIYDLAYYWPQYTPITYEADHDIMLFTFSKLTGHAGTRIGWALVKDEDVAKKMTKFIMLNTLGVSKDSQLRAAMIMNTISTSYESQHLHEREKFFDFSRRLMEERWRQLKEAIEKSSSFVLPKFPSPICRFSGEKSELHPGSLFVDFYLGLIIFGWLSSLSPAFAWLKCERADVEDCEGFLKSMGILVRGGEHFGADQRYARVSMLSSDKVFDLFIKKILTVR